jgi:hypothetical protein
MRCRQAIVRTERKAARATRRLRVPRFRRAVVVLLVILTPLAGTLDFVSLTTAARSATAQLRLLPAQASIPSWSRMTGWIGMSLPVTSPVPPPRVAGPVGKR